MPGAALFAPITLQKKWLIQHGKNTLALLASLSAICQQKEFPSALGHSVAQHLWHCWHCKATG